MNAEERRNLEHELIRRRDDAISNIRYFPGMEEVALDYTLLTKGLLFFTEHRLRSYLSDHPQAQRDYEIIMNLKRDLTRAEMEGDYERCSNLRAQIGSRERYIISDFVDFSRFETDLSRNSLANLQIMVDKDAKYLDFVDYKAIDGNGNPYRYCGVFILDGATKKCSYQDINPMKRVVGGSPYVWASLDGDLKGAQDVYFCPDGDLSRVAIEYLKDRDGHLYSERYRLHRVFHLSDIHPRENVGTQIVGIGVADYNSPLGKSEKIDRGSWTDLPKVSEEMKCLRERFKNKEVTILYNDDARESEVKRLDGTNVNTLHISAHGFYRDSEALKAAAAIPNSGDHNMAVRALTVGKEQLSGLVLRQGNLRWNSEKTADDEDDILTSEEVELLHFPSLHLTVLSACDTGLGAVSGEGVWGLQRAFRIAGSRNLICTFNKVDDYWSARFMEIFYDEISKEADIYTSFHTAQRWVAEQTPDNPDVSQAFILIE